ncbi:hypothetical protein Ptr902_06048 [Pyrenophora tritici-repentis]|nr:hypothetical protein L13192_04101 [Pyrenophora tritici-repentis]KAI2483731.1 hypothetical protein Ptr902_06048 [Pyrenophora tritici-repentis]
MSAQASLDYDDAQKTSEKSTPCAIESDEPKHSFIILSIMSLFARGRYLRLEQGQSETPQHQRNRHPWTHVLYLTAIATSAVAGGAVGYRAAATTDCSIHTSQLSSLGSCGRTSEVNRGSSCVYDFVMGSWIHSSCHDRELYAKYLEQVRQLNLTYYADPDGTTEVPLDIALRGDHPELWTSGGQHHLHCSYFWEKQLKAWKHGGSAWDTDTLSEEHTLHCILLNAHPSPRELLNETITKVYAPDEPIECLVG